MTTEPQVEILLVDAWFDSPVWTVVESRLQGLLGTDAVVRPFSPRPLPSTSPMVNGLDVVERVSAHPLGGNLRLAIGNQTGTGPVAALVNDGHLDAGVLLDPIMAPMARTDGSMTRFMPAEDPQMLELIGKQLSQITVPEGDSWGASIPDSVVEATTGAFTGDPIRVRLAELEKNEYQRRMPLIRHLLVPDEAAELLNWMSTWTPGSNDLTIWVSTPQDDLAAYLADRYPDGQIQKTNWPRNPVLSVPDAVADRIVVWMHEQIAKRENGAG